MCTPFDATENFLHAAVHECISGMSALNMEANPLPKELTDPILTRNGYIFLSESDVWVKHAYEHFTAVCDRIRSADEQKNHVESLLWKLMNEYPQLASRIATVSDAVRKI